MRRWRSALEKSGSVQHSRHDVDGTDPLQVYDDVAEGRRTSPGGPGPSLIESKFYRLSAHGNAITVPPVPTQFPRARSHRSVRQQSGVPGGAGERPDSALPRKLDRTRTFSRESELKQIDDSARAEMDDAVQFALASPLPAPEEATNYVYA